MSIASTPYRLADASVLIGVLQTPQGLQPLFTEIDGHSTVVAYTDVEEARADLPATHRMFSIGVAELLRELPPYAGLIVDPRSPSPVHVPAELKQGVIDAVRPFPAGADVRIGDPADEPAELLAALPRRAWAVVRPGSHVLGRHHAQRSAPGAGSAATRRGRAGRLPLARGAAALAVAPAARALRRVAHGWQSREPVLDGHAADPGRRA